MRSGTLMGVGQHLLAIRPDASYCRWIGSTSDVNVLVGQGLRVDFRFALCTPYRDNHSLSVRSVFARVSQRQYSSARCWM